MDVPRISKMRLFMSVVIDLVGLLERFGFVCADNKPGGWDRGPVDGIIEPTSHVLTTAGRTL